jgi:hypothetical protein
LRIAGFGSVRGFQTGFQRGEQGNCLNPDIMEHRALLAKILDPISELPRHAGYRFRSSLSINDKERLDQVIRVNTVLANQIPDGRVFS